MKLWPAPKDKSGDTYVYTIGVLYRVEGTGHSYAYLIRSIRNGAAAIVGDDVGGKGEK